MEKGVDPLIHRVATSDYGDTLIEIKTRWSVSDLVDALLWLDAIAEANEPDPIETPKG